MTPEKLIRRHYDKSPYPPPGSHRTKVWRLPPLDWILSMDRARVPGPKRVLVAGCGSGGEALLLQRALKDAEIIAVDFSSGSIQAARQAQARSPRRKRVHFFQADLTDPALSKKTGGDFDLVVCHGVLSYIPRPEAVLRNLAGCLGPDGLLYLGVNGAGHFSARLRPVLASLGIDTTAISRPERWRALIQMWEGLDGGAGRGMYTRLPGWQLGGDFFGPLLQNFSLRQWVEIFRKAGLCLRASFGAHWALRPIIASGAAPLFMRCPRAEICQLLDLMHPVSFHRLLLARQPSPTPPWENPAKLASWKPAPTGLYRVSAPKPARPNASEVVARLKSLALGTQFDWPMPRWEFELLRHGDGVTAIRQLLRETGRATLPAGLGEQLFLLYQFAALNLFPP